MKSTIHHSLIFAVCAGFVLPGAHAQGVVPERAHLDKILEKRTFTPEETAALNKDTDPAIDVRDLVIFLNGQPISAYFDTIETVAFRDQTSVTIPIRFTKPVTGTIRVELGGTAKQGADFGAFGAQVQGFQGIRTSFSVTNATSAPIVIPISNAGGARSGEKRLTLNLQAVATFNSTNTTVNRSCNIAPGFRPAHTIVFRNAWKSWIGTIDFPRESGFTSLAVRFLMGEDRSLRMIVEDSNLFQSASLGSAQVNGEGLSSRIVFTQVISGGYQPTGASQSSPWGLTFAALPSPPGQPAGVASYSADLVISNFPITGISKTVTGTMNLTLQN